MNKNEMEQANTYYPSRYAIGQRVDIKIQGNIIEKCYIRAIVFTAGKVRYSVIVEDVRDGFITTLHNIDSICVVKGYEEVKDFGFDNYS